MLYCWLKASQLFSIACVSLCLMPLTCINGGETTPVLFIGNSLTIYNNLPAMVETIARESGARLESGMALVRGASLRRHWVDSDARATIGTGKWDYVILQESPTLDGSHGHLRRLLHTSGIQAGKARCPLPAEKQTTVPLSMAQLDFLGKGLQIGMDRRPRDARMVDVVAPDILVITCAPSVTASLMASTGSSFLIGNKVASGAAEKILAASPVPCPERSWSGSVAAPASRVGKWRNPRSLKKRCG